MKYDKQYLYEMYNATSTEDENGNIETYENWLERQLISRIENIDELKQLIKKLSAADVDIYRCNRLVSCEAEGEEGQCTNKEKCFFKVKVKS